MANTINPKRQSTNAQTSDHQIACERCGIKSPRLVGVTVNGTRILVCRTDFNNIVHTPQITTETTS